MIRGWIPGFARTKSEYRYGDAQVLTDGTHTLVIDGMIGTGANRLIEWLKKNNHKKVWLIITHWHDDHFAGIEKILGARPRTKEFLIGYPALVCWYYLKRKDLWSHWREILRLAVSLAFTSAVNSFCHFHTPLSLTLLRGVNGWWTGLVFGCAILAGSLLIGRPVYNRVKGLFS